MKLECKGKEQRYASNKRKKKKERKKERNEEWKRKKDRKGRCTAGYESASSPEMTRVEGGEGVRL